MPSGGSADSMTLAIAHLDRVKQTVVIDCLREVRPPFSPEGVCNEFAETLRNYNLASCTGDRYAGEWPREQFAKFGINYYASAKSKTELYLDLLPLINSRRIELLDHPKSINQLLGLERSTMRGSGRDVIDHAPSSHDDIANVIAGVCSFNVKYGNYDPTYSGWDDTPPDGSKGPSYLQQRLNDYIMSHVP
jgi:hypothetical protein